MRLNVARTIETLVVIGLLMPVGMLFGVSTSTLPAVNSSSANWKYSEQATTLLNQMQGLAQKVTKELGPIQVQEYQLDWQEQGSRLSASKADINKMSNDLARLDTMKKGLEPWQKTLVNRVTPHVHELIYQANTAIKQLAKYENKTRLALAEYPENINIMYNNANQMAGDIGTVTQYAHAEQQMAALQHRAVNTAS